MSRTSELTDQLQGLSIRSRDEMTASLKAGANSVTPPSTPPMNRPTSLPSEAASYEKAATVFPSHVRAAIRRAPTDRPGDLVRLLDDISTVTHSISSYVAEHKHASVNMVDGETVPGPIDREVATQKLYTAISHDGAACIILEKSRESPLTFSDTALQGDYVVMLSSLDVDPTTTDHVFCGTIFSVYERKSSQSLPGRLKDLQQDLKDQVASGYVMYSSATTLYYTMGRGTYSFCLHPVATQYFLQPSHALEMSVSRPNVYGDYKSIYRDQNLGAAAIAHCSRNSGTVYDNGCLIANFHGAASSGSLFIARNMHLLCEAAPLAFIVEQLGGKAIDEAGNRILDMAVRDKEVHRKVTFCAGPVELVDAIMQAVRGGGEAQL